MEIIHNTSLLPFIKKKYTLSELNQIWAFLKRKGTFRFHPLKNGLFSAALVTANTEYTNYAYVWVRDNIHIAYAHYQLGLSRGAVRNLKSLMKFFQTEKQQSRFKRVIKDPNLAANPMERPHIRFDGATLTDVAEEWSHAQNDALGYFLWLYCKLANENLLKPSREDIKALTRFAFYFQAIQYWQDEDSGHWEEVRKISASSIGPVVAGLEGLKELLSRSTNPSVFDADGQVLTLTDLDDLIGQGRETLKSTLPWECIQPDPSKNRRYDAALLFLIYPLRVVDDNTASQIVADVISNLRGEYGIKRYLGDSFWAKDYKQKMPQEKRTADMSNDMAARDQLFTEAGIEAQWCVFDPIVSVIYGQKFLATKQPDDLAKQIEYFNRALGQITAQTSDVPGFKCPELYYLEAGEYIPNDSVPLLWTQANLLMAFWTMEQSLALVSDR